MLKGISAIEYGIHGNNPSLFITFMEINLFGNSWKKLHYETIGY